MFHMSTYKVVSEHTDGTHVRTFADADEAIAYAESFTPETDGSTIPNVSDETVSEFGGDKTYYQGFYWYDNRYAVMFNMEADYTVF